MTAWPTFAHRGGAWEPCPIYAHRNGTWLPVAVHRLPADLTPPIPPSDTTTIALTDLLVGAETLGTANDSVVMANCLRRAAGRTGPASGINTLYIRVDFEGVEYACEDPMDLFNFGTRPGLPNKNTIIHGNVANPSIKGGFIQNTEDGVNPNLIFPSSGKARNRYCIKLLNCRQFTFQSFKFRGANDWVYDVEREGQHVWWITGGHSHRFIDCDVSCTYGDVIFMNPYRPPGGGKSDDQYCGNIEALGGTWGKIGRIYITMNQVRAPDGIVDPDWWKNPGDGSGPFESHNSLPAANDAPSISGGGFGVWWHGNAAHPFAGTNCKRSVVDIENMNSYAHCNDVRIGADNENPFFPHIDRENFKLTGQGGNLISAVNGWGLINRLTIQRVRRIGGGGMSVRAWMSPAQVGYVETTIAPSMHLVNSVPLPSTIHVGSTEGFRLPGYMETSLGVVGPTSIIIRYTGKTATSLTGCTYHFGESGNRPFVQGRNVRMRFVQPERPSFTGRQFAMYDCVFEQNNASLLQLDRWDGVIVHRNRANFRGINLNPYETGEIRFPGCINLDLGPGPAPWGSNDFRVT